MKKQPIPYLINPLPSEPYSLNSYDPEVVLACLTAIAVVLATPVGAKIFRDLAYNYRMYSLDDKQAIRRYRELCDKRPSWEREQLCIHLSELVSLIKCRTDILRKLVETTTPAVDHICCVGVLEYLIRNEVIEYNRDHEVVHAMRTAA